MKQLIYSAGNIIITALDGHAFVVVSSSQGGKDTLYELRIASNDNERQQEADSHQQKNFAIQAVACKLNKDESTLLCAVSRHNKSIAIYSISISNDDIESSSKPPIQVNPIVVHQSNKRCCTLTFSSIPFGTPDKEPMDIIIAGDLAGDATAFPITANVISPSKKVGRLLLGHTASMLASIKVASDGKKSRILSADRDEKVRISSFPGTHIVEGYLLGHSEYISSMDIINGKNWCVTCSGDGTVRLWDYVSCVELAKVDPIIEETSTDNDNNTRKAEDKKENVALSDKKQDEVVVPVSVAVDRTGSTIAIIYDKVNYVNIYNINRQNPSLTKVETIDCPQIPLGLTFSQDNSLFILMKDPTFILHYRTIFQTTDECDSNITSMELIESCTLCTALRNMGEMSNVIMPKTILEVDETTGRLKVLKLMQEEQDGFVKYEPWLSADRIEKAKQASIRRKKRRKEQKETNKNA